MMGWLEVSFNGLKRNGDQFTIFPHKKDILIEIKREMCSMIKIIVKYEALKGSIKSIKRRGGH